MEKTSQAIVSENALEILGFSNFSDFRESLQTYATAPIDLLQVRRLIISGSTIDSFVFLKDFPLLEQLSFLACQSDSWADLMGSERIISLRLHNLKQGKEYLKSIGFIVNFPNLQYLYVNMLGLSSFSELQNLKHLHTIFIQCRNENDIQKQFDFSALEFIHSLKTFSLWMAVDRHRIPAESLIPVLKNSSLTHIDVTQMFTSEKKKLQKLIEEINPQLLKSAVSDEELAEINRQYFAW